MSNKSKRKELKYRANQQLLSKFPQIYKLFGVELEEKNVNAVRKLARKVCK